MVDWQTKETKDEHSLDKCEKDEDCSKSEKEGEVCMRLYLEGGHKGKFIKRCMVGGRVCSKKEPCPREAKYNIKYKSFHGDAGFQWECVDEDSQKAKDAKTFQEKRSPRGEKFQARMVNGTRKICALSRTM